MLLKLNGALREVPDGLTVSALLALLGVKDARVAVAVDGVLVPREARSGRALQKGDAVELIPLLGGG
jgi:sulfur carrier protein